jgi:hypothetical protein
LKYPPRILALFRFATRRTREAQSSPIPPKYSEPFFIPLKEVEIIQSTEPIAMTAGCECPKCSGGMRDTRRGPAIGQIPGLLVAMLSASLLLAELFSRPAITGRSMVVWSAAALALASATVGKTRSKRLNPARRYASKLRLWLPGATGSHNRMPAQVEQARISGIRGPAPACRVSPVSWPVNAGLLARLHPAGTRSGLAHLGLVPDPASLVRSAHGPHRPHGNDASCPHTCAQAK